MALTRPKIQDVDTSTTQFSDPLVVLNQGSNTANIDVGFLINRANGLVSNVAIYWSESSNSFIAASTSNTGITRANVSLTGYANFVTGSHTVNGTLVATAVNSPTIGNSSAVLYGTLNSLSASQPNITTLAGLTSYGASGVATTAAGDLTVTRNLTIGGNLTVNGTTTTINSTVITVDDIVVELGAVTTPTDTTAAGGGMILKGTTDKSITWGSTNGWTSTETFNIATGKTYKINGADVLSATALGTGVTASSLTSVGTITSGTWSASFGAVSGANLTSLNASNLSSGTVPVARLSSITTTQLSATAGITNAQLASSSVTVAAGTGMSGGGAVSLGGTITLTNAGVTSAVAGSGISVSAATGAVTVASTDTLSSVTSRGASTSTSVSFTSGVASTSTATGALVVTGGAGISGNTYVGALYVGSGVFWSANNNVISSGGGGSAPTGITGQIQYNNGGVLGASGLYYFSANGAIVVSGGTNSTSSTTGQIQVSGGLGVTGAVYSGSSINTTGQFISTVATGTAPLAVTSTTTVTNLSADLWDGNHFGSYLNQAVLTTSAPTFAGVTVNGTVTASTFSGSGASLTSLPAGNLTGTIPSAVLGNSTHYIGTTAIALNRASASQTLTGVSIDGSAGSTSFITVADTRSVATTPQTISQGVDFDLKQNSIEGLNDGGTYFGEMTFRQYGAGTDWSGGISHQVGFTDNGNIWQRSGSSTTWGSWKKLLDSSNYNGYSPTLTGTGASGTWGINVTGSAGSAATATTATNQSGGTVAATTGTFSTSATRNGRNIPTYVAAASAPASPLQGDFWYNSSSDVLYQYIFDGTNYQWVDQSIPTTFSTLTVSGLSYFGGTITPTANASVNIGSTSAWFGTVYGRASQAQYADLAERYTADAEYLPGTVVVFGGNAEVTVSNITHDTRVAGVISTDPAYLMNASSNGLPIALTGRVPCYVQGPVQKGDRLINLNNGVAGKLNPDLYQPGCIFGKSLEDISDDTLKVIEIAVGRY